MKALIIILLLIFFGLSLGAETLTLNGALIETEAQNPDLKSAAADVNIADAKRGEAFSGFLPHLGVTGEHYFNAKYEDLNVNLGGQTILFPSAFPQTSATFEASLNIFDGFASTNKLRAANLEYNAAQLELAQKQFELRQKIKHLYYAALAAQILVEVSDQNIKSLNEHLSLAKAQQRSGYATRFDSLRVEANLEEAQAERMLNIDNMILARKSLAREMGVLDDDRPLAGPLPKPQGGVSTKDLSLDLRERRDYQAQSLREVASVRENSAEHAFWMPKLSVFANETYYKFGSFDPAINATNYQSAYSVGMRLKWDLFDGGYSYERAREASQQAEKQVQETRRERLKVDDEFEQWKRRYDYNVALYRARVRLVDKSAESVRLAHLGLKAGTRTSSDALDAELELFKSRAGLVKANLDSLDSLLQLETALGHNLLGGNEGG
jgi:outer membrane protein TolC